MPWWLCQPQPEAEARVRSYAQTHSYNQGRGTGLLYQSFYWTAIHHSQWHRTQMRTPACPSLLCVASHVVVHHTFKGLIPVIYPVYVLIYALH